MTHQTANNGQSDIETPPISMSNVNMTFNDSGDRNNAPPKKAEKAQASLVQGFGQPRDSRS